MPNFWSTWCEDCHQRWTKSSIILTSEESVLRNKRHQKQDRFLRGRQIAYLIYEYFWAIGANYSVEKLMLTFSLSAFEMTIFRNSIQSETEFYCSVTKNPTWWHLGRIVQIKNTRVSETQDRIGIVWPGDSSEEVRTWLSSDCAREMEIVRRTPVVKESPNKTACTKNSWRLLGNGKPRGQCVKGGQLQFPPRYG